MMVVRFSELERNEKIPDEVQGLLDDLRKLRKAYRGARRCYSRRTGRPAPRLRGLSRLAMRHYSRISGASMIGGTHVPSIGVFNKLLDVLERRTPEISKYKGYRHDFGYGASKEPQDSESPLYSALRTINQYACFVALSHMEASDLERIADYSALSFEEEDALRLAEHSV